MTRLELINRMITIANEEVERQGYRFSELASTELVELISSGVNRMSNAELLDYSKIMLAQRNTRVFVERLCEKHRRETNTRIVESRTFSQGRMSICPIWPLC